MLDSLDVEDKYVSERGCVHLLKKKPRYLDSSLLNESTMVQVSATHPRRNTIAHGVIPIPKIS